jgi:hypothetical protein
MRVFLSLRPLVMLPLPSGLNLFVLVFYLSISLMRVSFSLPQTNNGLSVTSYVRYGLPAARPVLFHLS